MYDKRLFKEDFKKLYNNNLQYNIMTNRKRNQLGSIKRQNSKKNMIFIIELFLGNLDYLIRI